MRHPGLSLGMLVLFAASCVGQTASDAKQQSSSPAGEPTEKAVHPPKPMTTPEAEYPPQARDRHINGLCSASMIVDTAGMPQDIQITRCTDPVFIENSLAAVRRYRFWPATRADGTPIPVKITIVVNFRVTGGQGVDVKVSYAVRTPPGIISSEPDTNGVYPLDRANRSPKLAKFVDEGYGTAAFFARGKGACDVVLIVDAKGKASSATVTQCELPRLEDSAVKSLLDSHFKPGRLNGVAVPVRVSIHLEFGGYSAE